MASLTLEREASEQEIHHLDIEHAIINKESLLTAADDGKVKVWSTKDLSLTSEILAHDYAIYHLLVMNDDTLFTASIDQTIKAWEMKTWVHKATLTGHEEGVHRLATNGQHLFSGDEKGEVRKWTKEGKLCLIFGLIEEVWDLHVSENLIFTIRDKDLIVAEFKEGSDKYSIMFTHPGRAPLLVERKWIVFTDRNGKDIIVLENRPTHFQQKFILKKHEMIVTTLFSWSHFLVSSGYDGQIHLWDLEKGNCIASCAVKATPSAMTAMGDGSIFVGGPEGYLAKFKANIP